MNPSATFIARPVATTLLMVAVILAGLLALRQLPVAALPQVDYPTIQVTTFYPGASPDVMARGVTAPLERQFGLMPGLDRMSSTSAAGASVITLQFALTLPMDIAEQQVQAAISAANSLLPGDLPAPPVYAKVNPADSPILTLAATSTTIPLPRVADIVDTRVAQKLSQVNGVGLVSVGGGQRPAVRIKLDPGALAAKNLNIDDVRTTVGSANSSSPKGSLDGAARTWSIDANDQIRTAAGYADLVIAYRSGAPVRLRDVGEVVEGAENARLATFLNDAPAIIVDIRRQPGANVIAVVDEIRAALPELQKAMPAGVTLAVLTDRTVTIRASVHDVALELLLAVVLVVAVIFAFLRDGRATLIPALSVPLSLVGTLAVMYLANFSINTLTLMALTIATGFVVDDAIVMVENIARHIERGMSPLKAAYAGSAEIGFTVISLTLSLVAVLIPLIFMGDVVGRLFREFAITLGVSILISAAVSLTMAPMLAGRLMRGGGHDRGGGAFDRIVDAYGRLLHVAIDHAGTTLLVAVLTLAATVWLYVAVPKGFFPTVDLGLIEGTTEADASISFAEMARRQQELAGALAADPDVASLTSFIGVDGLNPTLNSGRVTIALKPAEARTAPIAAVIDRLTARAGQVGGIALRLQPSQELTVDSSRAAYRYAFLIRDVDADQVRHWAPRLVEALKKLPEIARATAEGTDEGATAFLNVDRDAAARFGITQATIDNALYDAFGQRIVSTIYSEANQYRVIIEVDPARFDRMEALRLIHLPSSAGGQVPLDTIVHFEEWTAPIRVDRVDQFPSATISFDLADGVSLGTAVDAIRDSAAGLGMPTSTFIDFQGAAAAFEKALANEILLVLAAIIVMYIVLGVLYESFIHPITILSTLPSAGLGALAALWLAGKDLDVVGIIGIVLLIGIVKKNAIMMIDFALAAEREDGMPPREAIHRAAVLRFRPILMTTLAALFGALPLMLGTGVGSELRHPLGIAIAGGLAVSQVLTLFTTPVIYLGFDALGRRLGMRTRRIGDEGAEA